MAGLEHVLALGDSLPIAAANLSVGGGSWSSQASCDLANASLKAAIDDLRAAGIATVAAAGNEGQQGALIAPACISSAVSVGATTDADEVASFSNTAPYLSLFAPGVNIVSSVPLDLLGFDFGVTHGTSMAAPHVSGAWSVLKQTDPDVSVADALAALRETGVPVTDPGGNDVPRLRLSPAVDALAACPPGTDPDADGICASADNCTDVDNPLQIDTDLDGYGNACDADYDNDGGVSGVDFFGLVSALGMNSTHPGWNPALDSDADSAITGVDFLFFVDQLQGSPGPSGLACAGSVPCTAP